MLPQCLATVKEFRYTSLITKLPTANVSSAKSVTGVYKAFYMLPGPGCWSVGGDDMTALCMPHR